MRKVNEGATMTTTKMGRPAIGPKIETRVSDELAERLQAYATGHGMTRAEAIRHLLDAALRIGDADSTLETLGEQSIEALFPEAEGTEGAEVDEIVMAEHGTVLYAEAEDHMVPVPTYLQVVATRGRWISVRSERDGDDWGHSYRVFANEGAARADFVEAMVAITDENWKPGAEPMWFEFSELEFFYELARSGALPIGAIDADGDRYPLDTSISLTGMDDLS